MSDLGYLSHFREELMASGMVLLLIVSASFFTVSRILNVSPGVKGQDNSTQEAITDLTATPPAGKVLGQEVVEKRPTESLPTPTIDPLDSEVPFGTGGEYDYDQYSITLTNPRLTFNMKDTATRKFLVEITLANKNIAAGLPNQVYASIVKDGNIIVPKAALSTNESKVLMPGENQTFEARLSLIEATDVKEVIFAPTGDLPQIVHPLQQ